MRLKADYEREKKEGWINSKATFDDYLAWIKARDEEEERARALGYLDKYVEPPELTEEDEEILDRAWAKLAEKEKKKRMQDAA